MLITVTEIGKFGGLKAQDGNFYSPSKFAKNLPKFEVGKTYDCEVKEKAGEGGKVYRNINAAREVVANDHPVAGPKVEASKAEVTKPAVEKRTTKSPKVDLNVKPYFDKDGAKNPTAWGRELSDYEVLKDRRIGVAGVVQAVIQSPIYQMQAELMEPAAVEKFLADKAEFWLSEIKRLSEK